MRAPGANSHFRQIITEAEEEQLNTEHKLNIVETEEGLMVVTDGNLDTYFNQNLDKNK